MSREPLTIAVAVTAVLLLAAGGSLLTERLRQPPAPRMVPVAAGPGERRVLLDVAGMTCASCAARVTDELRGTPGVVACQLDAPAGRAVVVCGGAVEDTSLVSAVTRAGKGFTATIVAP